MPFSRELVVRLRSVVNRARMIAEAPAGQTSPIGRQHPASRPPPARERSTLQQIADRLGDVRGDDDLLELIEWAEGELHDLTHGPDREPETREQFRYRVCVEYEGRPARLAAERERVSIALIRQIREEAGRDTRRGFPLPESVEPG